jgi:hypothetical protein
MISTVPSAVTEKIVNTGKRRILGACAVSMIFGVAMFSVASVLRQELLIHQIQLDDAPIGSNEVIHIDKETTQPAIIHYLSNHSEPMVLLLPSNESATASIGSNDTFSITPRNTSILAVFADDAMNQEQQPLSMNPLEPVPSPNAVVPSKNTFLQKNRASTTRPLRVPRNITLIVEFKGELGNYLSKLASARITQLMAQRKYPHIHIQLIGQHHSQAKWKLARDDLVRCFPTFRNFEFEGGIHDTNNDFATIQRMQESWLNVKQRKMLTNVRSLTFLDSLLLEQELNSSKTPRLPPPTNRSWKYSLPYLTSNSFSLSEVLQNEYYYNDIRKWMRFNETACCNPDQTPNSNEIVFHYRNFAYELRKNKEAASRYIFTEVSPNTAANVLFLHTSKNHPIAIISRFQTGVDQYVQALQEREISAHYVDGQRTGMEAFCYLLQAQYEIVGSGTSTFFVWATYLGNATRNRSYRLDQPQIQPSNETVVPLSNRTIETIQHDHRTFTTEVC